MLAGSPDFFAPPRSSWGDDVEERVRQLWVRLDRVNAAIARWEEIEANACVPEDLRTYVEPPVLSKADLQSLRATILGKLEIHGARDREDVEAA